MADGMATEKRLIDANALLSKFKEHRDLYAPSWEAFKVSSINVKSRVDEIDTCMADVINAPTVDAVEVETIKAWLYAIAMNNVGCPVKDFATACEEIISRLDGLRAFAKEGRADGGA